jgi:hypothetical protein
MSVFDSLIERFAKEAPVAVMFRGLFANILTPRDIDAIFHDCAEKQYENEILFSSAVELLALAVTKQHRSLHSAYRLHKETLGVSAAALYDKLQGTEMPVIRELVRRTAEGMSNVVEALGPLDAPLIEGYETLVLDGFHLAGTEHRLLETRTLRGAPLPGLCLAVLDPQRRLIVDMYPCADGHAQERSLLPELVNDLQPGELWIMDRNFCTRMWLLEIALNKAFFIVRHHAAMPLELRGQRRSVGRVETGMLYEQTAVIHGEEGESLEVRCLTLILDEPTADGETQLVLLSNLPSQITAGTIAAAYRQRWTIERAFGELTSSLHGEIDTLAYPPAALLACAIAFVMFNALSVVKTAIGQVHGSAARDELSTYHLATEIAGVSRGLTIAVPFAEWKKRYAELTAGELAKTLKSHARQVNLARYRKSRRGPKKPAPKRTGRKPHVSTQKLLQQRK